MYLNVKIFDCSVNISNITILPPLILSSNINIFILLYAIHKTALKTRRLGWVKKRAGVKGKLGRACVLSRCMGGGWWEVGGAWVIYCSIIHNLFDTSEQDKFSPFNMLTDKLNC